jgi:hypothetical protein
MRHRLWLGSLTCTLMVQACSRDGVRPEAARDLARAPGRTSSPPAARAAALKPAAASTDSTFDTTVVQDVRGERRFEYLVRPQGPRLTLIVRGDSTYNQVKELLLLRAGDTVPIQRIEAMPEAPPLREPDIVFEDVNADGYADLKLLGAWGSGGLYWWTWHFDPRTSRLVGDSSAANPVM